MANGETYDTLEPTRRRLEWASRKVRVVLALATVLALMAFLMAGNGGSTQPPAASGDNQAPGGAISMGTTATTVEAIAAVPIPGETSDRSVGDTEPTSAGTIPAETLPPATEVADVAAAETGRVSQFPLSSYSWERVDVDRAIQADLSWLGEINRQLVGVVVSWDNDSTIQTVKTYLSDDGTSWEQAGTEQLPEGLYVSRIMGDGVQVYLLVEGWLEEPLGYRLLTTADGVGWNETPVDFGGEDADYTYLQDAAVGPAGFAVALSYETYPEQEPTLLDFGDVQVSIDSRTSTYRLLDAATDVELVSGSINDLYHWSDSGQAVYDPNTDEIIVTIPYDVWEAAYSRAYEVGGTPLPLPVYAADQGTPKISIEYGGYVVELSETSGTFRVLDAASEDQIASGSLDYLYQGPPPRLVDPESGEIYLDVAWDEWYLAEEQGWASGGEVGDYTSHTELLTSSDGTSWNSVTVPGTYGSYVPALLPTADGFVALVNSYSEFGDHRSVWTMNDGVWSAEERESSEPWFNEIVRTSGGFAAVGDSGTTSSVWTSADGMNWMSEFAMASESDGFYASLTDLATDDGGTIAVLSQRETWGGYRPLIIEKDGYTLSFDDSSYALRVVDQAGHQALGLGWGAFDRGTNQVTWQDGVTYIELDDASVIAITDEEAYAAMESMLVDEGNFALSVFLQENGAWSEAKVDVAGALQGVRQVYLHDGKVILAGIVYEDGSVAYESGRSPGEGSLVVIVGTPQA